MKRTIASLALLALSALPVAAQDTPATGAGHPFTTGIKIRGDFHVNRSAAGRDGELPADENGYGLGLEINGRHLGVALYGYTAGQAQDFDSESTPVIVVAEANYFLPIQALRLAPYAGIHSALGTFTKDYFRDAYFPRPQDGLNDLGYQVGLRFKPLPLVGFDAQWRKQSRYAHEHQDTTLERTQILLGVTLF